MTGALGVSRRSSVLVLLLGSCTLATALLSGAFFETYEGPGLIGARAVVTGTLSLLLLAATLLALMLAARRGPVGRGAVAGVVLAVGAVPLTGVLIAVVITTLNTFGVYW